MKKLFLLVAGAALVATSCSDDLGINNPQELVKRGNCTVYANFESEADTRTQFVPSDDVPSTPNGQPNVKYQWVAGDNLGIFDATNGNKTNSLFAYTGTGNEFTGDIDLLTTTSVYAYYPYNETTVMDGTKIPLYIRPNQNFNFKRLQYNEDGSPYWTWNYATGSMASGIAPAVATGTVDQATQSINVNFTQVGAYVVVPIYGYTLKSPIKSVTLAVKNNGNYVQLSGMLEADMSKNLSTENFGFTSLIDGTEYTASSTLGEDGSYITLNCGNGINLDPNNPINFWFVVPATLPKKDSTVEIYIDAENLSSAEPDITYPYTGTQEVVGHNNIWWVTAGGPTAWEYNQTNAYIIDEGWKFIEYANLVSSNSSQVTELISEWKALYAKQTSEENMVEGNPKTNYMAYTDLIDMISTPDDISADNNYENFTSITAVKSAVIVEDIDFSEVTINLGNAGGGISQGGVPPYYNTVYGSFLQDKSIPSIGNGFGFTLSGLNAEITLSNLTITGNGMFAPVNNTTPGTNVKDLTFKSIIVDAGSSSIKNFLSSIYLQGVSYSGVTVGSGCGFKNEAEGALFGKAYSSWYSYFKNAVNVDESVEMLFANLLEVNASVDFTTGYPVSSFGKLNIQQPGSGSSVNGYVLTLGEEEEALELLSDEEKVLNPNSYGYSVVAAGTSYWTGTTYEPKTGNAYAENLAYIVQTKTENTPFKMLYNLNLMGNEGDGKVWWNNSNASLGVSITTTSTANTISNVYINGTKGDEDNTSAGAYLTLLGNNASTTGPGLTINGITIDNSLKNANAYIGAVAVISQDTNNITLNGTMSVTNEVALNVNGNAVGGAFAWDLGPDNLKVTIGDEFEFVPNFGESKTLYGVVAGLISFAVPNSSSQTPMTVTNPVDATKYGKYPAFGLMRLNYSAQATNTNAYSAPLITLVGFTAPSFDSLTTGDTLLGNIEVRKASNSSASDGDIVNVSFGSTPYYQLILEGKNYGFAGEFKPAQSPSEPNN